MTINSTATREALPPFLLLKDFINGEEAMAVDGSAAEKMVETFALKQRHCFSVRPVHTIDLHATQIINLKLVWGHKHCCITAFSDVTCFLRILEKTKLTEYFSIYSTTSPLKILHLNQSFNVN